MEIYIKNLVSENLAKLIAAVLIVLIGIIIARFLNKLIYKILHNIEINKILKKQLKIRIPLEETIASLIKYFVYFVTIILAFNQLGITIITLHIILTAFLIFIIALFIISIKDFIPNLIAGFYIKQKSLIKENNKIKIDNIEGVIKEITLTETRIITKQKDLILIPNSLLIKSKIIKKP
jgi:small conductance mechanosensitive channel